MIVVFLELLARNFPNHFNALVASSEQAKSLAVSIEVLVSLLSIALVVITTLGAFILKGLRDSTKTNAEKVDILNIKITEDIDALRQTHNEELRHHESSDRKSFRKVYDKLESEYVKKENLGLVLKGMSEDIKDLKDMMIKHLEDDSAKLDKRDAQIKELSDEVVKLKAQLGA